MNGVEEGGSARYIFSRFARHICCESKNITTCRVFLDGFVAREKIL
jgi:hypothetical protein